MAFERNHTSILARCRRQLAPPLSFADYAYRPSSAGQTRPHSVLHVCHRRPVSSRAYLLTTVGSSCPFLYSIAVWDISEDLHQAVQDVQGLEADPTMIATKLAEPLFAYQAHQSGINALEVIQSENSKFVSILLSCMLGVLKRLPREPAGAFRRRRQCSFSC